MSFTVTEGTKAQIVSSPPTSTSDLRYATDTKELIYISEKSGDLIFEKEGNEIPAGGSTGQALKKSSNSDLEIVWVFLREVSSGGSAGQYLKNLGGGNYDWATVTHPIEVPIDGIIMYNGVGIPNGFVACNGANGTPDLSEEIVMHIMRTS